MSKIGVQTFWTSQFNYGQLLQGYALQTYLKEQGHEVYIIRFDSILSKIKEKTLLILHGKFLADIKQKKLRKFNEFRTMNIIYSDKKFRTYQALKSNPPKADYYIVGSDQVWAYMRNQERRHAYLLKFGTAKKLAYAASFGRDRLKDDRNDYYLALKEFSFIGVREESGREIVNSLGYNATWVTDPVTLLTAQEWRLIKADIHLQKNGKKNVFMYTLANESQNQLLPNIKKALKKEFNMYYTNSSELPDKKCTLYPSPNEWLAYIDNSDIVVTDSFHCTMFCIIFNVPFVTIERENGKGMSNRLTSMLSRIGLLDRYTPCDSTAIMNKINELINWENTNKKLAEWIQTSKQQLKKNIE